MAEMLKELRLTVLTADPDKAVRRVCPPGDRTVTILGIEDVTGRLPVEDARRQRERSQVTLDCIGDAVIATDAEGVVTFLNPAAETVTGWGRAEAAGQPLEAVFFPVHETTRQPVPTPLKQVLGQGVGAGLAEHTLLVGRNGTERPIAGSAAPIRDGRGNFLGVVLVFRDVGPERQAERERAALLARAQAARAEVEAIDRRKDQFLAALGHELRSPLESLHCALHALGLRGHDAAVREATCALAARQVSQLRRLVDDLLDLSRIGQGKVGLKKERVDLLDVVARAVETARPAIEKRGQQLVVAALAEPVWLHADPGRLEQVLVNLVQNAAKYTAPGGRIDLKVERAGGDVTVRVEDTGIGITPDMLGRVFDLYTQAEAAREHAQGGLGIGLALVRGLVALHGGSVQAFSDGLGHGSEFIARLPADAGMPAEVGRAGPGQTRLRGRALRLLLADDDRDSLEAMALMLRLWGHRVETAHDGPSALAAVRAGLPEVALLDISLPGMDGHEVCRRLRREPGVERTFLVALTAHAHEDDHRLSREAGFDLHLDKPVDLDVLEQLLAAHAAVAPAERA